MSEREERAIAANTSVRPGLLRAVILEAAENLFPGYFAMVMATGIASIACAFLDMHRIAWALLVVNWIAYPTLWVFTLVRMAVFPRRLAADLSDHQRAPGFFTLVAGTCVFGTQVLVVSDAHALAGALWWFGVGLWVVVMYGFFTAVITGARKPPIAKGIHGAWLIAAVATHSIVILRSALDTEATPTEPIQLLVLAMFMIGGMLYLALIPLIFHRLIFVRLESHHFSPPYWIAMGAVAISTLAGATLILRAPSWPLIELFLPFLRGLTVFFWSVATWWIPLLVALMVWRHAWKRDRLTYEPAMWAMVFPLGMYTMCTLELGQALGWPFLQIVPEITIAIALAAWAATFIGLVLHIARSIRACLQRARTAAI
ncbi:MAG: tellurite resistance/C4-dicarboxylate transporter family protein [Alphaproteobacteria bacterium]|nr:tellurite resistance/C4-dicarboxylate transporter family protein [Alphaproteobacteria bacterium]